MHSTPAPFQIRYPEELPVSTRRESILEAIRAHQVVIVCGDTGSGKTTQLPKMMLEVMGDAPGRIAVTQPRRLAATQMAARVAEECGTPLGSGVGVQVRFQNRSSAQTRIQFMTDGLLLAQLPTDPKWRDYAAFIIDEAHERSLNIDFILGCLRNLLPRRPDLKVVISSATLDAERFSEFFNQAPILQVEGRLFPIQDEWLPLAPDRDLSVQDQVLEALEHLEARHGELDTLVFLPGEREIRDCDKKLSGRYRDRAHILPLFARLGAQDQQRVFAASGKRRIILATNVAETSLTIPGIRAVIDTGQVRMQRFHPQSRIQRLVTEQISRASARQRRGRCGRTGPGVCLRLYSPEDLERAGEYQDPEIRRSSLAEVILRMAVLGLPPIQEFPFIDPPKGPAVSEGYRTLFDIGAMTGKRGLTPRGRRLASFHLEPRLARMLEEGQREKVLPAVLVCSAFLSIQDPRERPAEKSEAADLAHSKWKDPASDFLGILQMWNAVCAASASRSRRTRFCREHFLHPRRVEEWLNLVDDLRENCGRHRWEVPKSIGELELLDPDALHRSILAGIPRSVGEREEKQEFRSPGGQLFRIFPGSALAKKPPGWVMTFTLLETSRLFTRECATLNPLWIEEVAPHLCRFQYERPVWNEKRGFVEAEERVSLGQLTLRAGKRVHYGRIDPVRSREIFIRDALLPGNLEFSHPSWKKYLRLRASLETWERKLRRPGIFVGTDRFFETLNRRIPEQVYTLKDFQDWAREQRWVPEVAELLDGEDLDTKAYPDWIEVQGCRISLEYQYRPGEDAEDGLHLLVREQDLAALPNELLEWTIPAWLPEKVEALIRSLDKPLRVRCNPIKNCVEEAVRWFAQNGFIYTHSLHEALAAFLAARLQCILAAPDLHPEKLPPQLRTKLQVLNHRGEVIFRGDRFPGQQQLPRASGTRPVSGKEAWLNQRVTDWPEIPLPETHLLQGQTYWPALVDRGDACEVQLFSRPEPARQAWISALLRLYKLRNPDRIRFLQKQFPLSTSLQLELSLMQPKGENAMDDLVNAVLIEGLDLQSAVPRDGNEFLQRCEKLRGDLFEIAGDFSKKLETVFAEKTRTAEAMEGLPTGALQTDLTLQSTMLWSPGWCMDVRMLSRYPVYLKGIQLRIQRAKQNPEKDRQKQQQLDPLLTLFSQHAAHLEPSQIREAFLKLEEYRLTLFAPECRPAEKMSLPRFERWLKDIQA
ncbi:MAG: ATP-dependent RNA helicase HrpA [Kiritimatiellia bacterium]